MNEEIMRILKMIEEGKISADKGKELIEMIGAPQETAVQVKNYEDKMLKIKVLSSDGDKVNVQLPIKVIKAVLQTTGKLPIQGKTGLDGVELEELVETIVGCLDHEAMGEIVNVESADGDIVKIVIE